MGAGEMGDSGAFAGATGEAGAGSRGAAEMGEADCDCAKAGEGEKAEIDAMETPPSESTHSAARQSEREGRGVFAEGCTREGFPCGPWGGEPVLWKVS